MYDDIFQNRYLGMGQYITISYDEINFNLSQTEKITDGNYHSYQRIQDVAPISDSKILKISSGIIVYPKGYIHLMFYAGFAPDEIEARYKYADGSYSEWVTGSRKHLYNNNKYGTHSVEVPNRIYLSEIEIKLKGSS